MTHAQHLAKYHGKPLQRFCECGNPSLTNDRNNPECARCKHLRTTFNWAEWKMIVEPKQERRTAAR